MTRMVTLLCVVVATLFSGVQVSTAQAEDATKPAVKSPAKPVAGSTAKPVPGPSAAKPASASTTYLLRYKFKLGETIRWDVEHQAEVRMTVSANSQSADTYSKSVKLWKVLQADKQGKATFIHSVESVQMRQKLSGRSEVTYDSTTDKEIPVGFQDVAKSVGKPLSSITLDATGKVLKREELIAQPNNAVKLVTIPLPEEPVSVGYQWTTPDDIQVTTRDGSPKKIQRRQQFTLEDVKSGIATIRVETQVLTPVNDPGIEAQLVQGETAGKIRFNLETGRIESQQMDLDKHVVGVQGETSSMHYVTRFTERLSTPGSAPAGPNTAGANTAARPKVAGPELPK